MQGIGLIIISVKLFIIIDNIISEYFFIELCILIFFFIIVYFFLIDGIIKVLKIELFLLQFCYVMMALREILKIDTFVVYQVILNYGVMFDRLFIVMVVKEMQIKQQFVLGQ